MKKRKPITIRLPESMLEDLRPFKDQEGGITKFIEIAIQSRLNWLRGGKSKNKTKPKAVANPTIFDAPQPNPQVEEVDDDTCECWLGALMEDEERRRASLKK